MAGKTKIQFTKEQMEDIVAMYKQGMSLREIQRRHDIHSPSTVYTVLNDMGIEWSKAGVRSKFKSCTCGNKKNPPEAKYCFACGRLIQSEEEIAIDKLMTVRSKLLRHAPDGQRESLDAMFMEAIDFIKIKLKVK